MWTFKGLGWFSRFVPPAQEDLGRFYIDKLGLPLIRNGSMQKIDFLWGGEAIVHQLIYEGRMERSDLAEADPDRAPLMTVYRVSELDAFVAKLRAKGVKIHTPRDIGLGREAYVEDPSGSLIGLREVPRHSPFLHDQVGAFRQARGEAFNPGCASLPAEMQELGWLIRRVKDLDAMERFYRDVMGFPSLGRAHGRALLDLGDNTVLELAPGGITRTPPENRAELNAVFILRVDDIGKFSAGMIAREVTVVHAMIEWPRGALTYVADPEGNLIGVEERFHPSRYVAKFAPFPEDLESQRRWIERIAAGDGAAALVA